MRVNRTVAVALIALVSLLASTVLPFFTVYQMPGAYAGEDRRLEFSSAASRQAENELFSSKVLICTAAGYKWVSLEALQSGQEQPQQHQQYQCIQCCATAHLTEHALPSSAWLEVNLPEVRRLVFVSVSDPFKGRLYRHFYLSRAPPVSIVV